jgi:hypothetical protein
MTNKILLYKKNNIKYIFTAGNHDCNFSDDGIRDILIKSILSGTKITNEIIENCTKVQKNYFEFIRKYNSDIIIEKIIFFRYEYNIDSYSCALSSCKSRSDIVINLVFILLCVHKYPKAIAKCILPTPLGPSNNIFSFLSTKASEKSFHFRSSI